MKNDITQELVKETFSYKNGKLYWKYDRNNQIKRGNVAGHINKNGYGEVKFNGGRYPLHKLIYMYHRGNMPKEHVDHINGNVYDNTIENLRVSTISENNCNRPIPKHNKSGVKNVFWDKKSKKFRVCVEHNKIKYYGGSFNNINEAELVAIEMRNKYHGEFANHG